MASSLSVLLLLCLAASSSAQLSPRFYATSCPRALAIIRRGVAAAVNIPSYMFLLPRYVNHGCDASVLLSDTASFTGEQVAAPNAGSIRGMNVIDNIKAQVEAVCTQTVSCADILAVAARDSVVTLGGPSWTVPLGRRDSTTASLSLANSDLPPPSFDVANLTANFAAKGLSVTDMVALSGAHTIGQAQCQNFRDRLYNETNIDTAFATPLKANCPRPTGSGDSSLAPLDTTTPNAFDNAYYRNLMSQKGLLHSDQVLINDGRTAGLVRTYSSGSAQFNRDFRAAMVRMGNISPLTGTQGQDMNFADVATWEQARELMPFPRLLTDEDRCKHRRRERRLRLAEMDEQAMALWSHRFPEDTNEEQFFAQRRAKRREERAAYREDKRTRRVVAKYNIVLGDASSWDSGDERFLDTYAHTSDEDITETESESDE
ncbi:Peroxidase 2 [Triticum urartu]|uniref:peroxidase n=1 Tax=Triticum urartu TaxID=4572 RepID=M7ZFD4_TRIUA|nr:Peroxidase 2 [Triticum urartu]